MQIYKNIAISEKIIKFDWKRIWSSVKDLWSGFLRKNLELFLPLKYHQTGKIWICIQFNFRKIFFKEDFPKREKKANENNWSECKFSLFHQQFHFAKMQGSG